MKPFIDSRLETKYMPEINGWGVFANNNIEANVLIEVAPVIVYPSSPVNLAFSICQAQGISIENFQIDQYVLEWQGNFGLMLGWTAVYNHSDNNNVRFLADFKNSFMTIETLREINAGEQVLVSYGEDWWKKKPYVKKVNY